MITTLLRCALCAVFFTFFTPTHLAPTGDVATQEGPNTPHLDAPVSKLQQPAPQSGIYDDDDDDEDDEDWNMPEEEPTMLSREWFSQNYEAGKLVLQHGGHQFKNWLRRNGKTIGILALVATGIVATGVTAGLTIGSDPNAQDAPSQPEQEQAS